MKNKKELLLFVGDVEVKKDDRFSLKNSILNITNIQKEDAGTYVCHYQDPLTELKHSLDILLPPEIVENSGDQRVTKGESVTLECKANGNPKPTITWSKTKGKLPSGKQSEVADAFSLGEVNRHVEGTYTCSADNQVGEPATASMKVTVDYKPEIITEKVSKLFISQVELIKVFY